MRLSSIFLAVWGCYFCCCWLCPGLVTAAPNHPSVCTYNQTNCVVRSYSSLTAGKYAGSSCDHSCDESCDYDDSCDYDELCDYDESCDNDEGCDLGCDYDGPSCDFDGPACDYDEGCDYSCDGSCACDYFPGGDPWATGESCECDQCDEDGTCDDAGCDFDGDSCDYNDPSCDEDGACDESGCDNPSCDDPSCDGASCDFCSTDCDTCSSCLTCPDNCPVGEYRKNCGGSSKGSCTACTGPDSGFYFTSSHWYADSCGQTACDVSCPVGQYTSGCEGTNAGTCAQCTNAATEYYYTSNGGTASDCSTTACTCGDNNVVVEASACDYDLWLDDDSDGICGVYDTCVNDAENDVDGDNVCGDVDSCPDDVENDADSDSLCGCTTLPLSDCFSEFVVDNCIYDAENDNDLDGVCSDVDCTGYWQSWGSCSTTCNTGAKFRTFLVTQPPINGTKCDDAEDYCTPSGQCTCKNGAADVCTFDDGAIDSTICNTNPCPIDCVGGWSGWTDCQADCLGEQTRTWIDSVSAAYGGVQCANADGSVEERSCVTYAGSIDCTVSGVAYDVQWVSNAFETDAPSTGATRTYELAHGDSLTFESFSQGDAAVFLVDNLNDFIDCASSGSQSHQIAFNSPFVFHTVDLEYPATYLLIGSYSRCLTKGLSMKVELTGPTWELSSRTDNGYYDSCDAFCTHSHGTNSSCIAASFDRSALAVVDCSSVKTTRSTTTTTTLTTTTTTTSPDTTTDPFEAAAEWATVLGGYKSTAGGVYSFVGGGSSNKAKGTLSAVAGGYTQEVNEIATAGVIVGGDSNLLKQSGTFGEGAAWGGIGGGADNTVGGRYAAIGGGQLNTNLGNYSVIVGGTLNSIGADATYSSVAGSGNLATGSGCVVAGGRKNKCFSNYGTVLGGQLNKVSGRFATVMGGFKNTASGKYSFAAGNDALASGDSSATFSFAGSACNNRVDNSILFCANAFQVNGNPVDVDNLASEIARRRRALTALGGHSRASFSGGEADDGIMTSAEEVWAVVDHLKAQVARQRETIEHLQMLLQQEQQQASRITSAK